MPDTERSRVHNFLNDERGIHDSTLDAFGVVREADRVGLPYPGYTKWRSHSADGKRHFETPKGAQVQLYPSPKGSAPDSCFLVEGESDCMRLWQELAGEYGVFGVPGVNGWREDMAQALDSYGRVYVILDNDQDYNVRAAVDKCWFDIRKSLGGRAYRITLPEGVNDVCEFFDSYDVEILQELASRSQSEPLWHFKALDLHNPPKEPDWFIEGVAAKGDLCMLIGEPNVGKSWLTMGITVAVASGHSEFLGHRLRSGSRRVLYVDEENPAQLVAYRLKRLGLRDGDIGNIRYLSQQGVRVDKHPEYLLEEAMEFDPEFIVLDSFTRLHTKDENHAGEVSALFNDGVLPLVRGTGATVFVLHHVNKSESGHSFTRARGSSDMSGVIDCGLDLRGSDSANLTLIHYKSRWTAAGKMWKLQIVDRNDDEVALVSSPIKARF